VCPLILHNYKYTALNADGKPVKGRIEAINRMVSQKYLETKRMTSISMVEYHDYFAKITQLSFGKILKTKQLIFFLKQLGSLLHAGINILPALELLALQQGSRSLRSLFFELYQQVYNGYSFSKALSKRPKEFPSMLIQMVEIGELSGELPKTVLKMADYYEKQMKISAGIKGAVRMPLIYLVAALLIAVGMLMFVFPTITDLFASFGNATLPPITQFFLDASDFVAAYALPIFGGTALLALVIFLLDKYVGSVHFALTVFMLRMPIFGKLLQMNNQIMIANSLSQMMASGINSLKALQTMKGLMTNVVYRNLITKTIANIQDGKPFSKSFEENNFVDPIMARMIATGEKTGDIPTLMENLSVYYNGISELRVEQLKGAIQPILLLIVYAIVGVMMLAIMLPMMSLGTQI
jgi:type IV pilus assembly protein PilC